MRKILLTTLGLFIMSLVFGQELTMQEKIQMANNPLAKLKMISFQNNFTSSYTQDPTASSNSMLFRWFQPVGNKWLVSINLPVTMSSAGGYSNSGIGGLNVFGTYVLTKPSSPTAIGIGPSVTAPTYTGYESSDRGFFDNRPWTAGLARLVVDLKSPEFAKVLIAQYNKAISPETNQEVNQMTLQPILIPNIGDKGTYVRVSPIMTFDFEHGKYTIPLGVGIGQILAVKGAILNFYVEPQYTVFCNLENAPKFNLSSGIIIKLLSKK